MYKQQTLLVLTLCLATCTTLVEAYPEGYLNHTGCLYAYLEHSNYRIVIPDQSEDLDGVLLTNKATFDGSTCTDGSNPGSYVVTFDVSDQKLISLKLSFQINSNTKDGYWSIERAVAKVAPVNTKPFSTDTFELKVEDMYAGARHSFSCNELVLTNQRRKNDTINTPQIKITLRRFQLQPFAEGTHTVFAPSYDCAVFFSMPLVMGLILMLFITFTVMIGIYLLMEQGNQTSDLKFSKQGGMLLNQAQLDATKG